MADAYIVDAVRSPTGRRKGGLADVHAADLGIGSNISGCFCMSVCDKAA